MHARQLGKVMSSDTAPTLAEKLANSDLREARNVLTLIESGASIDFESDLKADPGALLETYRTRSRHLARFTSHHAQRLRKSTEEFSDNLENWEAGNSIAHARVDDSLLGSYIIWYVVDELTPVGCLYVIGKSEVSSEVWEEIWHDA